MMHIVVRKKVIQARKKGLKIAEISRAYDVSESAIHRLLRRERETVDITPKTNLRGRKPELDQNGLYKLKQLIIAKPDITLEEIKEEMQLSIGISAISEIVRNKLGFLYKKNNVRIREK